MYYILAESGDLSSENFQMAKKVITKWIDWSKDYVFVGERPVTDAQGYYLNAAGQRILGGTNVQVATTPLRENSGFRVVRNGRVSRTNGTASVRLRKIRTSV